MFQTTSFSRSGHLPDNSHYRYSCSTSFWRQPPEDVRIDRLLADMAATATPPHFHPSSFVLPRTSNGPYVEMLDDEDEEDDGDGDGHGHEWRSGHGSQYPASRRGGRYIYPPLQGMLEDGRPQYAASSASSASTVKRPRNEMRAITDPPASSVSGSPAAAAAAAASAYQPKSRLKQQDCYQSFPAQAARGPTAASRYSKASTKVSSSSSRRSKQQQQQDQWPMMRHPIAGDGGGGGLKGAVAYEDLGPEDWISQISVQSSNGGGGRGGSVCYQYVPREERRGRTRRRGETWSSVVSSRGYPVVVGASTSMQTVAPSGKFDTRLITPYD
ncbi:hypothetical protein Slin15195_G020990 [Septoria linicola]|uniref:Uncharacterized protein n=1 Tax=Septoria linicola TaxID=215465 RepID=A0A9Q9EFB7_9PEZI|nr:hypothetical protein Slin14017_G021060 [Septoria linicola]USW48780.1 hypothetical protein Slin15195_G020990 [Septoria linicola]